LNGSTDGPSNVTRLTIDGPPTMLSDVNDPVKLSTWPVSFEIRSTEVALLIRIRWSRPPP
jgi:hypothetical protein